MIVSAMEIIVALGILVMIIALCFSSQHMYAFGGRPNSQLSSLSGLQLLPFHRESLVASLSQRIIFQLPFIKIFPLIRDLDGILCAGLAADICAAILSIALVAKPLKQLGKEPVRQSPPHMPWRRSLQSWSQSLKRRLPEKRTRAQRNRIDLASAWPRIHCMKKEGLKPGPSFLMLFLCFFMLLTAVLWFLLSL